MGGIHWQQTLVLLVLWHGFQHQLNLERVWLDPLLALIVLLQDFVQRNLV